METFHPNMIIQDHKSEKYKHKEYNTERDKLPRKLLVLAKHTLSTTVCFKMCMTFVVFALILLFCLKGLLNYVIFQYFD